MSSPSPAASEACDLCRAPIAEQHKHLLEPATRQLHCACDACAILFSGQQQKYRRVPNRVRFLTDFRMNDAQWDALMIPIGIVFFLRTSTTSSVIALYPSPAGPVESLLGLEKWNEIEEENPRLRTMEPDVEGLLAYRSGSIREYYIIPIDECFRLIGLIRLKWKGFSGGPAVRQEIANFLETLKQRSSK